MEQQTLRISMFGGFSISAGDKTIIFKKSRNSKTMYLLQYLLLNYGSNVSIEKLADAIYGNEEIDNPVKTLQVLVTRLRKDLSESGLEDREYICFYNGGYEWNTRIPCEIDVLEFERAVQEAKQPGRDANSKIELYTRAIELYKGDFLPNNRLSDRLLVISAYYSNLYMQCFENVWKLLREKGDYKSMMALCSKGLAVNPGDENLHIINISCLIEENRLKEALTAYHTAEEILYNELCIEPSKELEDLYARIAGKLKDERLPINKIRDALSEKNEQSGAYYCPALSFADSFRFATRMAERSGQSLYLMLCNLADQNGAKPAPGERLAHAAQCLHEAIRASLRKGDMFTRYSATQFLVLLVGTNLENCTPISKRIASKYRALYNGRGINLKYSILPATQFKAEGKTITFSKSKYCWN